MTLDQLVQALSSASADAREVLSKIKDIATVNGDVTLTFYDGTTVTLPGLPKLNSQFQQFMINNENIIKSWWNKAFYVDAENGDDNNPGTQDAPFKTLKKAIYSIPIGGKGYIYLIGSNDYNSPIVYTIDEDINVYNKVIVLRTDGPGKYAKILPKTFMFDDGFNQSHIIGLNKSSVHIFSNDSYGYLILENPKKINSSADWVWHHKSIFQIADGHCSVYLSGWPTSKPQIIMTDEGGSNIICANSRDAGASFVYVNFYFLNARLENSNCKIVDFYHSNSHVSGAIDAHVFEIKDNAGNNIAFKDIISGIIYDASTGLAKNILTASF